MLNGKRVYDAPARTDGYRVLVDRLWPRGLARQRTRVDLSHPAMPCENSSAIAWIAGSNFSAATPRS